MRNAFDEPEQPRSQRDTVLTLSTTTVLGIFVAGVLVCALFFALGFAVGRWGPKDSSDLEAKQKEQPALTASNKPKPSAIPQADPDRASTTYAPPSPASTAKAEPNEWPSQPAQQPVQTQQSANAAQPATRQSAQSNSGSVMVQIAAVAHEDDAAVLVSALRKRGYAVVVRRAEADDLIHVQIGPFSAMADAQVMRNRLLADGYNAVVMQ